MRLSSILSGSRLSLLLFAAACLSACSPTASKNEDQQTQTLVREAFFSFKAEIFSGHAKEALAYLDRDTLDYLQAAATKPPAPNEEDAQVRNLIRQVLGKLTPGGIGPGFALDVPVQRVLAAGWLNPHELDNINIGPIKITGGQAQAEIFWENAPTTLQIYFLRQNGWKVDLITLLPYAQAALRSDRAIRRETDAQQLDRLVSQVPVP